jgi:chloride channel 7
VYKHWIKRQMVSRLQLDRWLMMGMIGFVVGVIGFLLHQLIEQIADFKWEKTQDILQVRKKERK